MGLLAGLITYSIQIGYTIVKALVFYFAFNYFAPFFSEQVYHLPVIHITYWISFTFFIVVYHVGEIIQTIVPTIVKIDNSIKENKK